MAISLVGVGTKANGTAAITPVLPGSLQTDDLILIGLSTANQAITATGYNDAHTPQGQGTAAAIGAVRCTVLYRWYQPGDGNPTTSDSGNHQVGNIVAFRGVDKTTPFLDTDGANNAASNTQALPGLTSAVAGAVAVYFVADDRDIATDNTQWRSAEWLATGVTGSAMAQLFDNFTSDGVGGGIAAAYGDVPSATTLTSVSARHAGTNSFASSIIGLMLNPASSGGTDILDADDLSAGEPTLGSPAIGQVHALGATALAAGAPTLGSPAIGQVHSFAATGIDAGEPTVAAPAFGQVHNLTASGLATDAPVVGTPPIGQIHEVLATSLATGAPVLAAPDLAQTHALAADGLVSGTPILDAPELNGNTHNLVPLGISSGAPSLDTPEFRELHALTAAGIDAGAPILEAPAFASLHMLAASGIDAGAPTLAAPAIGQLHEFNAQGFDTGLPVFGSVDFAQLQALAANDLDFGPPELGAPSLDYDEPPVPPSRRFRSASRDTAANSYIGDRRATTTKGRRAA